MHTFTFTIPCLQFDNCIAEITHQSLNQKVLPFHLRKFFLRFFLNFIEVKQKKFR